MTTWAMRWRAVAATCIVFGVLAAPSGVASAHPLGNFSVSHLNTITLDTGRIRVDTVIDSAEVPTAQDRPSVDSDGDGIVDRTERSDHARTECEQFARNASLVLDGRPLDITTIEASFGYEPGQAGLETSRLDCGFEADVPADFATADRQIEFTDAHRPGRVGWHEINAVGVGVGILDSPVPASSVTNGLRSYPEDLLSSPLDVRSVTLDVGPAGVTASGVTSMDESPSSATTARDGLLASRPGVLGSVVDGVQTRFDEMIGRRDLTIGVGLLAIGLSLALGASHALLPGHGKTVMAAYIAGRQGTARDAVLVGATVTATHTGGVLLLGLGLTVSTALAGETVLGYLGVVSGALIALLGLAMLVSAVRRRDQGWLGHGHHHHDHDHDHEHDHRHHDHEHRDNVPRRGLIGMGVAGGLVPSPSALIVLLSAIALGRTWFGVVLVVGYGLGMAIVLTLAGLLLVGVRNRLRLRLGNASGRLATAARRWTRLVPLATAGLVLVVGSGLAIRSITMI